MSLAAIKAKYATVAIERSGCWLLNAKSALEFVNDLATAKIHINGIESYRVHGNTLEPSLENSLYLIGHDIRTTSTITLNSISVARSFLLARIDSDLHFDFDLNE